MIFIKVTEQNKVKQKIIFKTQFFEFQLIVSNNKKVFFSLREAILIFETLN